MPIARVNDSDIYYETTGDPANPALLVISGIADYTAKCAWQTQALDDAFHVIYYDNRGAGRSTQPPPGYTMVDLADDAAALLDHLEIDRANVFAFSMGGMIALNLAIRHPSRIERLALGCTSAGGRLTVNPDSDVMQAMLNSISCGDPRQDYLNGAWISLSEATLDERPGLVGVLADIAADNRQTPMGYAGQLQAILSHDVADQLARIQMQVLVMHGAQDRLIPVENGRLLAAGIPGARFVCYGEAGHLFFIERAADVNRELLTFFLEEARATVSATRAARNDWVT